MKLRLATTNCPERQNPQFRVQKKPRWWSHSKRLNLNSSEFFMERRLSQLVTISTISTSRMMTLPITGWITLLVKVGKRTTVHNPNFSAEILELILMSQIWFVAWLKCRSCARNLTQYGDAVSNLKKPRRIHMLVAMGAVANSVSNLSITTNTTDRMLRSRILMLNRAENPRWLMTLPRPRRIHKSSIRIS